MGGRIYDLLWRVRRTPPGLLPGKVARVALRPLQRRVRRWRLHRARGELSDRALLRALGGRFRTVEAAVDYFQARQRPRFFVTAPEARLRAQALARHAPHLAERTLRAADLALQHTFDLLGSGPVALGPRLDWHTDFKVGYTWPRQFYEDIDYSAPGHPCDVKVPWELSRCHHWVTLGRAYALDPDPRYAREFVSQLEAWLDENPWPFSVNWGRAIEVAVRAANWLWAAALFADAPEFHARARLRLLKALLQHGRHILDNLEHSNNNGNHYLANGVGLLFLGVLLPEFAEAEAWRRKGLEIVWGELERQVHPDGVDFEKGIGYQGLVLEFWYSAALLCDLNGIPVPEAARQRLERMFEFMLAYTRPDGTFPQIGDNDDGRLAGLDDEPIGTHRRHLAVGGARFGRPDQLGAAEEAVETAVWLCGADMLSAPRTRPEVPSHAFPLGGFYVLRGPDAVMVVDAGEVGMNGIGGHGHNDLLSFDLWAAGAPLIVDSGTYAYTADPAARQALRATAAHNTVRVDGEEIARLGEPPLRLWRIEDDAHPIVHAWESDAEHDLLDAQHDGYARLPEPVVHRRRIRFDKRRSAWVIQDTLDGVGEHDLELFLHLARPLAERMELAVRLRAPRADLWIVPLDFPGGATLSVEEGWVSRGYGYREPAPVLRYAVRARLPISVTLGLVLVPVATSFQDARALLASID
ncbi:MAG: alginate lyase family protein [Chloroflexi bacterium]|nr:alginate lyase family protein [Chloroflexota bacterium]